MAGRHIPDISQRVNYEVFKIIDDDDDPARYYVFLFQFSLSIQQNVVYYVQYMCTSIQPSMLLYYNLLYILIQ